MLEEELLFPANTQVAVFVSMDVGDFFALDSVTLKIDNKEVINYLYTPREVEALLKGGVQRLYLGNLKVGQARAGGVLHRQGSARARLQARRVAEIREGHRRQVPGAEDRRPAAQAAAGIRDQGLGIAAPEPATSSGVRCWWPAAVALLAAGPAQAARTTREKLPDRACSDLHYGDVLFHYYQHEDDFEALTRLLGLPAVGPHAAPRRTKSQLLLGGLYL